MFMTILPAVILALGLIGVVADQAQGAERAPVTYHVSPTGSDDSDGTAPGRALRSITRVNAIGLLPGDTVAFEGGARFPGNLLIAASGTAGAFITITSYGQGRAAIEAGDSYAIRLLNCQYIRVRNLELVGSGVSEAGVTTNTAQGLDIFSTATTGQPWRCIEADLLAVSGFRDGIVLHTPLGTQEVVGYDGVRVTNCTIRACLLGGFYCWGSRTLSGAPWNLPRGAGVFTNCYLGSCTIERIYGDPVGSPIICLPIQVFNATGFLVERCTVSDCGQSQNPKAPLGGVGGLVFLESERCIAQFNEVHHIFTRLKVDGCAFDIDGGCTDCILQYNYSHDNDGSGYQTMPFPGSGPTSGGIIRYNLSVNDGRKNPGKSGGIMTWGKVSSTIIHNNTVIMGAGPDGAQPAFTGHGGGATVCNNLFVVDHAGDIVANDYKGNYVFQNNAYYRTSGGFGLREAQAHYDSLAAWRAASGQERRDGADIGFCADPLIKAAKGTWDRSSCDPLPGSPLIGAGLDVQALFHVAPGRVDVHGAPLSGKPDIGAVQGAAMHR